MEHPPLTVSGGPTWRRPEGRQMAFVRGEKNYLTAGHRRWAEGQTA